MKHGIGIEIGATKQQVAVGDEAGNILHRFTGMVDTSLGAREVLRWLESKLPQALDLLDGMADGIGVGFGGIVERGTGRALLSVQVRGWENVSIRDWLMEKYRIPAVVENDTVLGGVGELLAGSGRGLSEFFYTNIGSGIGGAIFTGGVCVSGQRFGGAYFGQTLVPSWEDAGEAVTVESLCSGLSIEKRLRASGYIPADSSLWELCGGDPEKLDCRILAKAALEGDPFAREEIVRVGDSFGIGLANIVSLLHPQRIAIGGGVAQIGESLLNAIRDSCLSRAFAPLREGVEIVPSVNGQNAVLTGALLAACGKWRPRTQ